MLAEILRLIRTATDGISKREICEKLNISKAVLDNAIMRLINEGYDIEEDENGLVMYSYPENLTAHEILSRLETKWCGKEVVCRKETSSTNDEAMYMAEEDGRGEGFLVVAEHQSGGKGRRGRVWESPRGTTVSMSLILKPNVFPDRAPMITLVMALAVADVLQKLTDLDVKIKWPNDVLINKKKVCGILTEMSCEPNKVKHVVVGVGINVNVTEFPEEIASTATSLLIEKGNRFGRADLVIAIMDYFEYYYEMFLQSGDLSDIVGMYDSYLINKDAKVKVLDPKGEYEGTAEGINDFGELIVQKDDGSYARVDSGEVSVRGIYGYV